MRGLLLAILAFAPAVLAQQGPMECGTSVSGTFAQGPVETHTFTAQGGDSILIRGAISSQDPTFSAKITVLDGTGQQVLPRTSPPVLNLVSVVGQFDLPVGGVYVIRVQSSNIEIAGAYRLSFTFLNRSCNSGTLSCGSSFPDSFELALQMKTYQFEATAGDILTLRVSKTPPFTAGSSLIAFAYSASARLVTRGTQAASLSIGATGAASVDFAVAETGTLTIIIFDRGFDARANSYNVTVARLNGPCYSGKVLTCGSTVQGNFRAALTLDTYATELQAGDIVSIRTAAVVIGGALKPIAEIYDAQGRAVSTTVATLTSARALATFTFTAPADGMYNVLVRDTGTAANTGAYAVTLVRLNRPCGAASGPLGCGSIVDGSLNGLLSSNLYTLPVSAGDTYMLRLLHNDQNAALKPRVEVFDERANTLQSLSVSDLGRVNFTARANSVYTLLVSDSNDYSQSGTYTLSLQRLNRPCNASPLSCGTPVAGNFLRALAPAVFTSDSAPGQSFTARMLDTSGTIRPVLDVYDSAGNAVGSQVSGAGASVDVVNAAGGTYTIVATDGSLRPVAGPFSVELLRTTNACAATPPTAQTLRSLITTQAPFQVYSLPLHAGDALSVRSASLTTGFSAQMELYDPSGTRVDSQTFGLARRAPADGTYTVVIGAASARSVGAYAFSWQLLNDPAAVEPLVCGGTLTASLTAANQFRYYSAAADPGDLLRLIFTRTSDNFAPQIELYDPTGARIAGSSDISQRATAGGSYLVVVSPSTSNGEIGSFVVSFQRPNHPCNASSLACGATTLRRVLIPGQLDTYSFTGTPGNQASIRLTPRSGSYTPMVEMYDAGGALLGASSSGALLATLPPGTPYALLIRDRQGTNLGSYRVNVQDNTKACPVDDKEAPTISLMQPTGGEVIAGSTAFRILWESDDNVGVTAHQLALSTDGGTTFATAIASNVSGVAQSFVWSVPADIAPSRNAILRVTATDAAGNSQSAMSAPLSIIGSGFTPTSTTTFTYDALNRVTAASSSDGRAIQYVWDAAGNLVQIVVVQP